MRKGILNVKPLNGHWESCGASDMFVYQGVLRLEVIGLVWLLPGCLKVRWAWQIVRNPPYASSPTILGGGRGPKYPEKPFLTCLRATSHDLRTFLS